jgi:hypothetical protein
VKFENTVGADYPHPRPITLTPCRAPR